MPSSYLTLPKRTEAQARADAAVRAHVAARNSDAGRAQRAAFAKFAEEEREREMDRMAMELIAWASK